MRIGLTYDLHGDWPWRPIDPPDADAEFEPEETVRALEAALEFLGHDPVRIGGAAALMRRIASGQTGIDAVVNIAEGVAGPDREAQVPVLLALAGIPCLGSDALTLSLSLDKVWTKLVVAAAGVPTPAWRSWSGPAEVDPGDLPGPWPLMVKPRSEGSAKGITRESRVEDLDALRRQVARITTDYRQDALVEVFIEGGGEYTVTLVGGAPPEVLPVLARAVELESGIGLHALEHRGSPPRVWQHRLEGDLDPDLEMRLGGLARRAWAVLRCRDFARFDFRVDETGTPWFLEANPLPTFALDSAFAVLAELEGRPYPEFLATLLATGLERLRLEREDGRP
jgi:D-alanine-D-alanine ligase